MNFILSCSTRYLTRSLRSLVRYRVELSKIKFISTRGHVISSMSLLCGFPAFNRLSLLVMKLKWQVIQSFLDKTPRLITDFVGVMETIFRCLQTHMFSSFH